MGTAGAGGDEGKNSGSGGSSSLGALSAQSSTSVGGALASDSGESALRNQSAEVHFIVETTQPTYWRTGAFDAYTGQGWARTGDSRPSDGTVNTAGLRDERIDYRITLQESATAAPTAWQPSSVSLSSESLYVLPGRSLASAEGLPAGTTYTGVSYAPPRDRTVLASAGQDYPEAVESRYATLPENRSSERVAAFTDDLTADASTPYEKAVVIEEWLEANREYSLNSSHDPEAGTVTEEFLFNMKTGYCEYFATAMTVMLRTQDVPARYAVGYSTGQPTGDGEYTVRAMNAHAWVEVYFPEAGWVRFDPTPASSRLDAEGEAYASQTGESSSSYLQESGSADTGTGSSQSTPGDTTATGTPGTGSLGESSGSEGTDSAGGSTTGTPSGQAGSGTTSSDSESETDGETPSDDSGSESDSDSEASSEESEDSSDDSQDDSESDSENEDQSESTPDESDSETDDSTTPEPEPIEASLNRTAVPGAVVEVTVTRGGEPVSDARVLFNDDAIGRTDTNGTVVGEVPYASSLNVTVEAGTAGSNAIAGTALPRVGYDDTRVFDVGNIERGLPASASDSNETTYPLDTNATVSIVGDVRSNATVTVVATVDDVPVRDANVRLDGTQVATTDARGQTTVRLPSTPGNHTISVGRGPVEGSAQVKIRELGATHRVGWPIALPTAPVTVTATLGNDTVAGATVHSGGTTLGQTGVDGNATVAVSASNGVTYTVAAYGQTATTTVTGAVTNAAGVTVALLLVLGVLVRSGHRRGVRPRRIPGRVYRTVRRLVHAAVSALVAIAEAITGGVTAIRQLLSDVFSRAVALRAVPGRVLSKLTALAGVIRAALVGLPAALRAKVARTTGASSAAAESVESASDGEDAPPEAQLTVRRAWREFLRLVPVRRVRRRTPGEVARRAIDTGLPAGPVTTLRDAYREVEYGGKDPTARLGGVQGALSTLTSDDDREEDTDDKGVTHAGDDSSDDGNTDHDRGEQ
nr:DUF3488 and transglutaminase-like domain-containing protein [Halobaculum sp. DT31]